MEHSNHPTAVESFNQTVMRSFTDVVAPDLQTRNESSTDEIIASTFSVSSNLTNKQCPLQPQMDTEIIKGGQNQTTQDIQIQISSSVNDSPGDEEKTETSRVSIEQDVVGENPTNGTDGSGDRAGDDDSQTTESAYSVRSDVPVASVMSMIRELKAKGLDFLRVKLYIADEESGNWIGSGIGIIDLKFRKGKFHLVLRTDQSLDPEAEGPAVILDSIIDENIGYSIQEESVITWNSGSVQKGLSFVRKEGCRTFWSTLTLLVPDRIVSVIGEDEDEDEEEIETEDDFDERLKEEAIAEDSMMASRHGVQTSSSSSSGNRFCRDFSIQTPPRSAHDVDQILHHLRMLNDPKDPTLIQKVSPGVLQEITREQWLGALWHVVDESIGHADEEGCAVVADMLCYMIAMYAVSSNPFTHLALSPTSEERNLDPDDPLVRLLSNDNYVNFFRAMEYESELRKHGMQIDHVEFLRRISEFRDVICKEDDGFSISCQFIYRVLYLRDVCLPRHLDEATIQRLTVIVNTGYAYVCRLILLNPCSLQQLRDMIPGDVNAARFLLQLLTVLRSNIIATPEKNQIYNSLKNDSVIDSLTGYFTADCAAAREWPIYRRQLRRKQAEAALRMDEKIRNDPQRRHRPQLLSHERMSVPTLQEIALDIFSLSVEHSPSLLRHSLLSNVDSTGSPTFWYSLCDMFRNTDNLAMQIQLSEIFRKVLDPVTLDDPEKDDLLILFYDREVIDRLIDIVLSPPPQTFEDLFPRLPNSHTPYFIPEGSSDEEDDVETSNISHSRSLNSRSPTTGSRPIEPVQSDDRPMSSDEPIIESVSASSDSSQLTPTRSLVRRLPEPDDERPAKRRASTDTLNSNQPVPINVPNIVQSSDDRYSSATPTSDDHSPAFPVTSSSRLERRLKKGDLTEEEKEEILYSSRSQLSSAKCQICEILSFCVLKHNFRIKYRNFQRHLHVRLIEVSCDPVYDQFFALYSIKFLKACLITESEHYARLFIKYDVFVPVFHILCHCVPKPKSSTDGSIVESAILELLGLICRTSQQSLAMATLLKHIVERHSNQVEELNTLYSSVCHYDLFKQLQEQYNTIWQPTRRWSSSSFDSSSQRASSQRGRRSIVSVQSSDGDHEMNEQWIGGKTHRSFDEERQRRNEENYFESDMGDEESPPLEINKNGARKITNSVELQFEAFMNSASSQGDHALPLPSPRFSYDDEDDEEIPDFLKHSPSRASTSPRSISNKQGQPDPKPLLVLRGSNQFSKNVTSNEVIRVDPMALQDLKLQS